MESNIPQDDMLASQSSSKAPVVRGARACTVCRAAKMKCVGAEDGTQPCQRCKRSNSECIFEKHRRGRKPGSKLSEASKMLRRLEKGLSSAKSKAQALESSSTAHQSTEPQAGSSSQPPLRHSTSDYELPPLNIPPDYQGGYSDARRSSHDMDPDQDEDDADRPEENIYPARLIRKENQRQPFLKTILNPQHEAPLTSLNSDRGSSTASSSYASATPVSGGLNDPVAAGIIEESNAKVIFDLVFLRLNPFINLFDAILHTPEYVRKRSPFLFTVLIMAGCKFFKPECYKDCQKLAYEFAVRAFAEGWKSVEVVQAFACLTYWKEPDDTRTWTYIGYACRMAVELGLNRWIATPARNETELVFRERRNRERTYLVLFVHDRSLSMQTGRQWMLPECNLVRNSANWHEEGGPHIRPEDVILAAFVQLRRIAAETTDILFINKGNPNIRHADFDGDVLLRTCNSKLTQWAATWETEMRRAPDAEKFHYAFLDFFRLYVRLFLNSAGIQASLSPQCRATPSLQALSACYSSAMDHLKIVTREFASMSMLRYGQDTVTVMTAYAAVFLLKLLRSSNTLAELHEGATNEIHTVISNAAAAYEEASGLSPASTSASYHARFLRGLVAQDIFKARQGDNMRRELEDRGFSNQRHSVGLPTASPHSVSSAFSQATSREHDHHQTSPMHRDVLYPYPASPHVSGPSPTSPAYNDWSTRNTMSNGSSGNGGYYPSAAANSSTSSPTVPGPQSSEDMKYWNHMFRELGLGFDGMDTTGPILGPQYSMSSSIASGAGPMPMTAMPMSSSHGQGMSMGGSSSTSSPASAYGVGHHVNGRGATNFALQTQYPPYHSVAESNGYPM